MMDEISLISKIKSTISKQNGIIMAKSVIVHRQMYSGQDILAPNSSFTESIMDSRGYLPVEWWIMSYVNAENNIKIENEGITILQCDGTDILFTDALAISEKELLGVYKSRWPLTKVLDIGGQKVSPNFNKEQCALEVPPVPCHVHAGLVINGACKGCGKDEAYFFPPLDIPPYHREISEVNTRIGIRPEVTQEQFVETLKHYGKNDQLYELLQVHTINTWENWMIPSKLVHAPGPRLTFEIQRPQDDFNLLAWRLGVKLSEEEMAWHKENLQLKGLKGESDLLEQTIDWQMNIDGSLKDKYCQKCKLLDEGVWGKRIQIFHHLFYGEAHLILPSKADHLQLTDNPIGGICWSGEGRINGLDLNCLNPCAKEFLITPQANVVIENTHTSIELIIFLLFPMQL